MSFYQTSVESAPPVALAGLLGDSAIRRIDSRLAALAILPGLIVIGDETTCELPDSAGDVENLALGASVLEVGRDPEKSFDAKAAVPVISFGTVWVQLLSGAAPTAKAKVYVYRGATTANRGKVTQNSGATDVTMLPGGRFTGRVTTGLAEVELFQSTETIVGGNEVLDQVTLTFDHEDLSDADTSQTLNVGAALPAGATIIGREVAITTAFSGGAVSDVKLDLGGTDPDGIIDGLDIDTGTGTSTQGPSGVLPNGSYGGQQLVATIVTTGGNLADLTAGEATITVTYAVFA